MARHRRAFLLLVTECRRSDEQYVNMAGDFAAQRYFGTFYAINSGVPSRPTALDTHFETGDKPQVHEMLGYGMVQLKIADDSAVADLEVGQQSRPGVVALFPSEYEVENHFQFHFYSNPFPRTGNDQSHS
jgi:hypothetical protein